MLVGTCAAAISVVIALLISPETKGKELDGGSRRDVSSAFRPESWVCLNFGLTAWPVGIAGEAKRCALWRSFC